MPQGIPTTVTTKIRHRSEVVKVLITLDRGQLEDLELIGQYRHGQRSRSVLVREAVSWMLAREAMSLVRYRDAERKRREREALDAQALILSSTERERRQLQSTLAEARRIASPSHARARRR